MNNDQLNKILQNNYQQLEKPEQKKLYQYIVQQRQKGAQQQALDEFMQQFGITKQQTNRIINELLQTQYIVQQQSGAKKTFYMAEVAPESKNLPIWYNQQHFDQSYADELLNYVKLTVQNARSQMVNLEYITNVVRNQATLKSRISEQDVKTLVNVLVYDNVLHEYDNQLAGCKCYQLVNNNNLIFNAFYQGGYLKTVPCGKCQLINVCEKNSGINAKTCAYIEEWLQDKE